MKLDTVLVALSLFGTALAFAPQHMAAGTQRAPLTELEMTSGAKHKSALNITKKVAATIGGITLTTTSLPASAHAARAAVESAKGAKDILAVGAGAFATGVATNKLLKKLGIGAIAKTKEDVKKV